MIFKISAPASGKNIRFYFEDETVSNV